MEQWWIDIHREKLNDSSEKNLSQCHLSTTNPTCTDLGMNPGLHSEKPATNCLIYGTADNPALMEGKSETRNVTHLLN
jgi:hypothetical protein